MPFEPTEPTQRTIESLLPAAPLPPLEPLNVNSLSLRQQLMDQDKLMQKHLNSFSQKLSSHFKKESNQEEQVEVGESLCESNFSEVEAVGVEAEKEG